MWYPVIDGLPLRLWVRLLHHTLCAASAALQREQAQISDGVLLCVVKPLRLF
ncbi:hypothetical protein JOE25_002887 [Serratia sp. PL17]|nr:hypothetical protein [Serratia sp. PL17]